MDKFGVRSPRGKNAGVLVVDLEGKPVAYYHDHQLSAVTSGIKIGNRLYTASLIYANIISLNLDQYPATATV